MIKLFKEVDKKFICIDEQDGILDKIERNMWIHVSEPTPDIIEVLSKKANIDKDILLEVMDEEESARLDVDDDYTLIVLDIPIFNNGVYETYPFIIIYNDDYYITLCKKRTQLLSLMKKKFRTMEPHKHVRLTLQIMYRIASKYIASLKYIDNKKNELEIAIRSSMKNKDLLSLMSLNKSLVYFSTSLNANKVVLNKVKRLEQYKRYEVDFDLMEDVEVENNQAIETCIIYRDILAGLIDANASIISNNLNISMRVLAIITLIIEIPTLVASIFGMNVKLPFMNNEYGFYIIIGISAAMSLVSGFVLYMMSRRSRIRRPKKK